MFEKATKSQARLRLGLMGPAGSGKTYSSLCIAKGLGPRIAVIDSERGSASKYAGDVADFDVCRLDSHAPRKYSEAIRKADELGYDVVIVDSLSHAWTGKDGALELVDRAAKRSQSGNSFMAWREVTPQHNEMIDAILQSRAHVIVTMRTKTEYTTEVVNGKTVPKKVGLAPIQRDGLEYEFDVVGDMDLEHNLIISKTRCSALDREVFCRPGEEFGSLLKMWLSDGAPMVDRHAERKARFVALLDAIDRTLDAEAVAEQRVEARRLKSELTRDEQMAVFQALKEAEERALRLARDQREAAEAERALAAEAREAQDAAAIDQAMAGA